MEIKSGDRVASKKNAARTGTATSESYERWTDGTMVVSIQWDGKRETVCAVDSVRKL